MADTPGNEPQAPEVEAGVLFRSEMWLTNFFLGYWPHLLAVLGVMLLSFFLYGEYSKRYQRAQRGFAANISSISADAPNFRPGFASDEDKASLKGIGEKLVASADEFAGAARVEALLKAAEFFRLAGDPEARRGALDKAVDDAMGPLKYSSNVALANLDIEQGNEEAAVSRLRKLIAEDEGFYAQQASVDLGFALEHFGKKDEARELYTTFLEKWPDASTTEDVRRRLSRLEGTQG